MKWRDLLNVQNTEKGFFPSSNSYGIPDIKAEEFEINDFSLKVTLLLMYSCMLSVSMSSRMR